LERIRKRKIPLDEITCPFTNSKLSATILADWFIPCYAKVGISTTMDDYRQAFKESWCQRISSYS
jgi:hypothetical protein